MKLKLAAILPHPPVVVPEIGKDRVSEIKETYNSFITVSKMVKKIKPDTIVVISSHNAMYHDYINISKGSSAYGSFRRFNVDVSMEVNYDEELVNEIIKLSEKENIPLGKIGGYSDLDHGTMVPLYFINQEYNDYKLVRIGISGLNNETHYKVGKIINNAINNLDKKVVVIASGDMSHKLKIDGPYGISKEGLEYDKKVVSLLKEANFEELIDFDEDFLRKAAECGHKCFIMLGGVLDAYSYTSKFLSYEGTFGVGYGAFVYEIFNEYVELAKDTIEEYVTNNKVIDVPGYVSDYLLDNRAGVFVTIYKNGALRGCIGTINPTKENIAKEIISNAISSCSRDPRFSPVKEYELKDLVISVDVLGESEEIDDFSKLDVKKYGVIVSDGFRRGLLLPNLEGVDTVEYQVEIALRKAGISKYDEYTLERFEVVRHEM